MKIESLREPAVERLEPGRVVRTDRPEMDGPAVAERGVAFEVGGVGAFDHAHTVVHGRD